MVLQFLKKFDLWSIRCCCLKFSWKIWPLHAFSLVFGWRKFVMLLFWSRNLRNWSHLQIYFQIFSLLKFEIYNILKVILSNSQYNEFSNIPVSKNSKLAALEAVSLQGETLQITLEKTQGNIQVDDKTLDSDAILSPKGNW